MFEFNFDEWAELAKTSPQEFERRRTELLTAEIEKAPTAEIKHMARMLQLECDSYHQHLSPISATIEISKLMLNHQGRLKQQIKELHSAVVEYSDALDTHHATQLIENIRAKLPRT